jgi:hypothetical protein
MKRYDDNMPPGAEQILYPNEGVKKPKVIVYDDENDEQYEDD